MGIGPIGLPLFGGLYGPEAIINGELLRGIFGGGRPPEFSRKKEDCLNRTGHWYSRDGKT